MVSNPSLSLLASSFSDELSWIIELLEKDGGMAFQEGLGDSGTYGEKPFSLSPIYLVPSATLPKC